MIVCKEYEARISALIDDELTAEERIEVLEHIALCPACKAHWEACLAMRDALREEVSAPAGFAESVMARVQKTAQEQSSAKKVLRFPGWKRFAGLAACCAVVILSVWMIGISPEKNMSDCAVSNRSAAPEAAAESPAMNNGACTDTADGAGSYSLYGGDNAATCGDPSDEAPTDATGNAESSFPTIMTTASELAADWVKQNLGENWLSGASYSLSEGQYFELRTLLRNAGESFSEITGNENGSGYLLLAE